MTKRTQTNPLQEKRIVAMDLAEEVMWNTEVKATYDLAKKLHKQAERAMVIAACTGGEDDDTYSEQDVVLENIIKSLNALR